MRNLFIALLFGLLTISLVITEAQAKRFGGGRSFGYSRSISKPAPSRATGAAGAAAAQKPGSTASKWLGPLAGLAIGGLLASLLMGHGLGTGILMWLVIAVVAFLIWQLIRSRLQPQPQSRPTGHANFQSQSINDSFSTNPLSTSPLSSGPEGYQKQNISLPDFDETTFLRQAKSLFIRLQAAYDAKNLNDIREFTTPEVFAEIQLQIQERGNEINQTEVMNIDAQLLEATGDPRNAIASVLFSGLIREQQEAEPIQINEIWHFQKNIFNSNWLVAGIQQENE